MQGYNTIIQEIQEHTHTIIQYKDTRTQKIHACRHTHIQNYNMYDNRTYTNIHIQHYTHKNTDIQAYIHTKCTITQNTDTNIHKIKHKDTHTIPTYAHTSMQTFKHTKHNHTHAQSYKNAFKLTNKHTIMHKCTPTRIQEDNTMRQEYKNTRIRYKNTIIQAYTNANIHAYKNTKLETDKHTHTHIITKQRHKHANIHK